MNLNVENSSLKKGFGLWLLGAVLFLSGFSAINYGVFLFPEPIAPLYFIGLALVMCSTFPLALSAEVFFRHAFRRFFKP